MIGLVGWIVLGAAVLVWEGIGLARSGDAWPTLTEVLRTLMQWPVARWSLFALWLLGGWHLFVRMRVPIDQ